jgi:hypothetical protein
LTRILTGKSVSFKTKTAGQYSGQFPSQFSVNFCCAYRFPSQFPGQFPNNAMASFFDEFQEEIKTLPRRTQAGIATLARAYASGDVRAFLSRVPRPQNLDDEFAR